MIDPQKIEDILSQVRKPGRYLGNEWNAVKKDLKSVSIKFALAFPDLYEVGMSHLGFKLLYHLLNENKDIACERVFSPDADLEDILRKESTPIFTLESKEPLSNFDIIGFSLAYELNYTNLLNIMDLASLPLRAKDRDNKYPIVIAGGPASFNPEPMSDFIDLFIIGEAEEAVLEVVEIIKTFKTKSDYNKKELLQRLSKIKGVYAPALYRPDYNEDRTLKEFEPLCSDLPSAVSKRSIPNLNTSYYPTRQIVPCISIVHDRVSIEIMRGCPNLCRFCQARTLYHYKRERSMKEVVRLAEESIGQTGYEEVSLLSLSSGNHSQIVQIITALIDRFKSRGISVSLPSLRLEKVLKKFPTLLSRIRKSGLTFAPEAGSERLRKVINKNIDMDELRPTIEAAYDSGWKRVKLYFMIGLPTESYEDIDRIIDVINGILKENKKIHINVSIASFIPKPHTPFQWAPMEREEELNRRYAYIAEKIKSRRVKLKFHNTRLSLLEGIFARGDRRLGGVILRAFEKGCRFDGWTDSLPPKADAPKVGKYELWMEAFKEEGIDPSFYIYRNKDFKEILPWEHIDCGLKKAFLMQEMKAGLTNNLTSCII